MASKSSTDYTAGTIVRGLQCVELIAKEGGDDGLTLTEVAVGLGVHKSNVYRYLTTLCTWGWLETRGNNYRVGPKVLQIAGLVLDKYELRKIARPYLEKLASETGKTVHLGTYDNRQIIYMDKVEGHSAIRMQSHLGMSVPAYCTSIGRAILIQKSNEEICELFEGRLEKRGPNTIVDVDALLHELENIRRRGYSVEIEENEASIGCIGSPIFDSADYIIAGISISMLASQLEGHVEEYSKYVMEAAKQISANLGSRVNFWPQTGMS